MSNTFFGVSVNIVGLGDISKRYIDINFIKYLDHY